MYFNTGDSNIVFRLSVTTPNVLIPTNEDETIVAALVYRFGLGTQLPKPPSEGTVYDIDGISYTASETTDGFTFTPAPSAWE